MGDTWLEHLTGNELVAVYSSDEVISVLDEQFVVVVLDGDVLADDAAAGHDAQDLPADVA